MGLNIEKRSLLYMVLWFDGLYGLCFFLSLPEYFDCKTNPCFLDCLFAGPLGSFSEANWEGFKPLTVFAKSKKVSEYASIFEQLLLIG